LDVAIEEGGGSEVDITKIIFPEMTPDKNGNMEVTLLVLVHLYFDVDIVPITYSTSLFTLVQ
jgi:hypothetical protein